MHIEKYPHESLDEHSKGMSGKVITGIFELNGQHLARIKRIAYSCRHATTITILNSKYDLASGTKPTGANN
ncbi:MAG TPA: hypothetical protein PK865_00710 [Candidatus Saccharibacteria bacterium]|nr:hypothetical protein [Candidatus Saccharibacteria bacterium]